MPDYTFVIVWSHVRRDRETNTYEARHPARLAEALNANGEDCGSDWDTAKVLAYIDDNQERLIAHGAELRKLLEPSRS